MFQIAWTGTAFGRLSAVLRDLPLDEALAVDQAAADLADRPAVDPLAEGESRSGPLRVAFTRPDLATYYVVDVPRRVVSVVRFVRR